MNLDHLCYISKTIGQQALGMYVADETTAPKKSPLHDRHRLLNAQFIVFGDTLWVDYYGDNLKDEYLQLTTHVAVCDITPVNMIAITGPDLLPAMRPYFTNRKLTSKKPGTMIYGGFVKNGKLVDDGMIFVVSDQELLLTINLAMAEFQEVFSPEFLAIFQFTDLTDRFIKLQLQGPGADQLVHEMFQISPLPFFHFQTVDDVIFARCGFTLPGGYELYLPLDKGVACWDELIRRGVTPYGISVMEISRVESLKICHGQEFGAEIFTPAEVGLADERAEDGTGEPLRVRLAYLVSDPIDDIHNFILPEIGQVLHNRDGIPCGIITSFVYSPWYDRYVGFCQMQNNVTCHRTQFQCNGVSLTVTSLGDAKTLLNMTSPALYKASTSITV